MSLDINFSKVKNYKAICIDTNSEGIAVVSSLTTSIAFTLLCIGMTKIEGNEDVDEFLWRTKIFDVTEPKTFQQMNKFRREVMLHKGLKVNVNPMTRKQFMLRMCKVREEYLRKLYKYEARNGVTK